MSVLHNHAYMTMLFVAASGSAAIFVCGVASASTDAIQFHSIEDGSIYTKPYTGLKGSWNEEFGVAAPFATYDKWTLKYNVAYIQTWPLKTEVEPIWTEGATVVYQLSDKGVMPGLYTKLKGNQPGPWQQESGLTAKWRTGQFGLVGNAGYVYDYPRDPSAKPLWQIGLSLNYYFK